MDLAEIEWTKISEVRLVDQIIIDAEVEGVLAGFRRIGIADPVEASRNDLDWLI